MALYGDVSSPELDDHIGHLLRTIPGCLALLLVDLRSGLQLAGCMLRPVRDLDLVVASATEWLQGPARAASPGGVHLT